ncbi:oligosaccharide flippase family protein [Bythopirellula goksoeyrii]|uniref:Teichuronic acid biosynthesis protein TuaB n=1 Tax=Bythopirellula goksoeyrii TaxID=1400387 RepID=A0A5B9QAX0_9BACT|nr:oligosaccharide flippase family protein [Bythopirellula goksoeyrii]QEG34700.1 Teichuronic acid biosynthesis protein TuaB [Bythopirellula goksoeyrii]
MQSLQSENDGKNTSTAEVVSGERLPSQKALGKTAGSGFTWLSLTLAVGKLLSFVTQIVLGRLLLDEDFGVFAIATSIANFLRILNDGGVAQVLIQRGPALFEKWTAPAFWIGICFSLFTGIFLAAASPWIAALYGDSQLVPLLWVFALTIVISAPTTLFKAKLRIELRFRTLAWVGTVWFFLRYLGVIYLAYRGYGAMSFVLPLPLASLFECVAFYILTRMTPWKGGWQLHLWPSILGNSTWAMLSAFARGLARNGDYIVLGLLVSPSLVGQYFFGYQLTAQFAILMASNVQFVLFPVLSHLATDPGRQSRAIIKTIRVMMLVSCPICLLVAINIEVLEAVLWDKKWSMAVPLMQIFSIVAPIRLIPDIVHAAITSRGEFRRSANLFLLEGAFLMLSVWLAASITGANITGIALIVATLQTGFSLALTMIVLSNFKISISLIVKALMPAWLCSMGAALITVKIGNAITTDGQYFVLLAANTAIFCALFLLFMRLFFSRRLAELAGIIPPPWDSFLLRSLFLDSSAWQN